MAAAVAEGTEAGNELGRDAAATAPGVAGAAAATVGGAQQPASPADREAASRTFYTSIDAEQIPKGKQKDARPKQNPFHTLQATNAGPRLMEHHTDLTQLAYTLDQRMQALLNEHEKDFFLAYKTHMYSVQRDLKALRIKADTEEAKTREDTTIKALEGELDWFMTEALRLDELCKGYKKEVDKWKQKADALDEDRRFLEDQIKGAKRQNKILRAAAERARSSAYSALMVTKARTDAGGGANGGVGREPGSTVALPAPPQGEASRRPLSAGVGSAAAARPVSEVRAITPDTLQGGPSARSPSSPNTLMALPPAAGATMDRSSAASSYPALAGASPTGSVAGLLPRSRSVLGTEAEERYVEAIQHLKESIVREQHTVRMLQASRATSYSQKTELEEFFLKCIDESRKDLMRKRHMSLYKEKGEREQVLEAMLNNEDVLVCLYEKLFPHRTGIARSLGGAAGEGTGDVRLIAQTPVDDSIAMRRARQRDGYGHGHGHSQGVH